MKAIYEVNIDFDEASKAWLMNKRRVDESYVYICGATTKKGKCCQNKRYRCFFQPPLPKKQEQGLLVLDKIEKQKKIK